MTDQNVEWLERNMECNPELLLLLPQEEEDHSSSRRMRIQVASLTWGKEEDIAALLHPASSSSRLGADDNTTTTTFDWIVGSDILYDHSSHRSLVATLKRFAQPGKRRIALAYPKRQCDENSFLSVAREHDFDIVTVEPMEVLSNKSSSSSNQQQQQCSLAVLSLKGE
jgi:predicted nicotinamide N-methyase